MRLCFLLVLLEGWKEYQDKETGKPYYHHAATNHTQWDRPAVAAAPMAADAALGWVPYLTRTGPLSRPALGWLLRPVQRGPEPTPTSSCLSMGGLPQALGVAGARCSPFD